MSLDDFLNECQSSCLQIYLRLLCFVLFLFSFSGIELCLGLVPVYDGNSDRQCLKKNLNPL